MYYILLSTPQVFLAMAKTAVLVGIISMIMMQSVSGAPKINYDQDHVENAAEERTEQGAITARLAVGGFAIHLADKDWGAAGQSDPYMEVVAEDEYGYQKTMTTPVIGGTDNPHWDYLLFDEHRAWKKITVKIMDYDGAHREPDPLCPTKVIILGSVKNSASFDCNPGRVTINYHGCHTLCP